MKFAKELDRDLVPEWRLKYLNYKQGKKKLKAINRALRNVNGTPRLRRRQSTFTPSPFDAAPKNPSLNRNHTDRETDETAQHGDLHPVETNNTRSSFRSNANGHQPSAPGQGPSNPEEEPLNRGPGENGNSLKRYGSTETTPRKSIERKRAPPSLKLPSAALDTESISTLGGPSVSIQKKPKTVTLPPEEPETDNAFEVGKTKSPPRTATSLPTRYRNMFIPKRINSFAGTNAQNPRPLLKRVFSLSHAEPPPTPTDVPLEAYRELDTRQAEFFEFLDSELDKIEEFYKEKEDESTKRLNVLREQLHVMRDRHLDELVGRQASKLQAKAAKNAEHNGLLDAHILSPGEENSNGQNKKAAGTFSWATAFESTMDAVKAGKYGKTTKSMTVLATPTALKPQQYPDDRRDYVRRPENPDVPYQTAKRKLKVALQEYYRGLELLKSYALLNRTAFRKINKKYDKCVNARPAMRYMTEKVNKAWFVNSEVVEDHIRAVEDLYARYFEKGRHKVAVGKLRVKIARPGDYTDNTFRNGLLLAGGTILGVQGLINACELLVRDEDDDDGTLSTRTSYLLQIYAGYFLMNFLFLLFCLACRVWHESKINYVFVFEYDTRTNLDWRQLSELPCWYFFLLGLVMRLNFDQIGGEPMYIYYPVILLGIATIILFLPLKRFYYRSRLWILYSVWRLLLAGLYPVEWRDFYLGDMFCSLTYSMGNIELYFCLYAHLWGNPAQCNSSNSRLLGFFTALPGIWRALQCIRRYNDTGNKFPHLLNCGKYTATIMYYVTLSVYRIDKTTTNRALFITFATINAIYCSFWDVYYDWSLGDPDAKYPFLRQTLGYKKIWMYYAAIIVDPILRFNWVFYAIIPLQLQHSAVTSFAVAISEICRRGMWSLFRVENEHCTNVGRFRASRDVPLPYDISTSSESEEHEQANGGARPGKAKVDEEQPEPGTKPGPAAPSTSGSALAPTVSGTDIHHTSTHSSARMRHAATFSGYDQPSPGALQRGLSRVGTIMRDAHAQDFERKKPEAHRGTSRAKIIEDDSDDEDEEVDIDESGSGSGSGRSSRHDDDDD